MRRAESEVPTRDPDADSGFRALIFGVLSVQAGVPVGWKFENLLQVGHRLFDGHKEHLFAYCYALRWYKREALVEQQDKTGKWAKRIISIRTSILNRDQVNNGFPRLHSYSRKSAPKLKLIWIEENDIFWRKSVEIWSTIRLAPWAQGDSAGPTQQNHR